jgi:competence protein ComEA
MEITRMKIPFKMLFTALVMCASFVTSPVWAVPVDINSATAEIIADSLTGIGPVTAGSIVSYREMNGPFKSADDLVNVKGIGTKTLEKIHMDILLQP